MPKPPELGKPFANATERAQARSNFLRLGSLLEQVTAAASGSPIPTWLDAELSKPLRGFREPPERRLNRYHAVFADELHALTDALDAQRRNRLDDSALRAANYLAQRLLASLLDCRIDELPARTISPV